MLDRATVIARGAMVVLLCGWIFTGGCSRSRTDAIREHSARVETNLERERNTALLGSGPARDAALAHLNELRLALSVANVSLASVPILLADPGQREIGYAVLDEAIGVIDWNIPLANLRSSPMGMSPSSIISMGPRPFPALFNPRSGLDFGAIQAGRSASRSPARSAPVDDRPVTTPESAR